MVKNVLGVEVPAGTDAFDPQVDMVDLGASLAGRLVVPVANVAARAQLVADLTAQGTPPSATNPLVVLRADGIAGREVEYSLNGTTFRVVMAESTPWTEPTLGGGWLNYGSSLRAVAYRRVGGDTQIRGTIKSGGTGVGNPIFTLPAGFRPLADETFLGLSNGGVANLYVSMAGQVFVAQLITGGNEIVSLAGLSFTADGA